MQRLLAAPPRSPEDVCPATRSGRRPPRTRARSATGEAARFTTKWRGDPTIVAVDRDRTFDFGTHNVTHANLLALDDAAAASEISTSKQILEQPLGHPVAAFCYPAGLYGERERRLVRASGFEVAVSADPGRNERDSDRLALRRIGVGPRDRMLDFRAKVGGGHDCAPPLRSIYRALRFGGARSAHRQ